MMEQTAVVIPTSLRLYFGDRLNKEAIDLIMGRNPQDDFSLQEVGRFYEGRLASEKVKFDYWTFLVEVFRRTWEPAITKHLPRARLLNFGEQKDVPGLGDHQSTLDKVWTSDWAAYWQAYKLQDGHFAAGVTLDESGIWLQFYFGTPDGDCTISNDLQLGSGWKDEIDNDTRCTQDGLLPLNFASEQVDIGSLAGAAQDAVQKLAAALVGR